MGDSCVACGEKSIGSRGGLSLCREHWDIVTKEAFSRISALEDTIDLERAQFKSWRNAGYDTHALTIIAEIESRRGDGWKGAR